MVSIDFAKFIKIFLKMHQKPPKATIFCKSKKNKLQKWGVFGYFLTKRGKGSIIRKALLPFGQIKDRGTLSAHKTKEGAR